MFKTLLKKTCEVLNRINTWVDKDADKQVASIIIGLIILLGIIILNKFLLAIFAAIIISNRVMHRFQLWWKWSLKLGEETPGDEIGKKDKDVQA